MELMSKNETLTIGKLASESGVGVETLRYYEKEGLIPAPPRRASGYRQYPYDSIKRVKFILRAKDLGFTLSEIKELLSLRLHARSNCTKVKAKAKQKLSEIQVKIESLSQMKEALDLLVKACDGKSDVGDCPILSAVED